MSDNLGTAGIIAATIAAVGGAVTAVASRRWKVDRADYAERLVGSSVHLVEQLQAEIERLGAEIDECRAYCDSLSRAMRRAGISLPAQPGVEDQHP